MSLVLVVALAFTTAASSLDVDPEKYLALPGREKLSLLPELGARKNLETVDEIISLAKLEPDPAFRLLPLHIAWMIDSDRSRFAELLSGHDSGMTALAIRLLARTPDKEFFKRIVSDFGENSEREIVDAIREYERTLFFVDQYHELTDLRAKVKFLGFSCQVPVTGCGWSTPGPGCKGYSFWAARELISLHRDDPTRVLALLNEIFIADEDKRRRVYLSDHLIRHGFHVKPPGR